VVEIGEGMNGLPGVAVTVHDLLDRFVFLAGNVDSSNTTCRET
jgi:hypothetical protein